MTQSLVPWNNNNLLLFRGFSGSRFWPLWVKVSSWVFHKVVVKCQLWLQLSESLPVVARSTANWLTHMARYWLLSTWIYPKGCLIVLTTRGQGRSCNAFMTQPWKAYTILATVPIGHRTQPYSRQGTITQGHEYQELKTVGGYLGYHWIQALLTKLQFYSEYPFVQLKITKRF